MPSQNSNKKKQKEESSTDTDKTAVRTFIPRSVSTTAEKGKPFGITLEGIMLDGKVVPHPDKESAILHSEGDRYVSAEDNYEDVEVPNGNGKEVDRKLATERLEKRTTYFDDRDWVTMTDDPEGIRWQPHAYEHNIDHMVPMDETSFVSATTNSFSGDMSRHSTIRQRRLRKIEQCTWTRIDRIMQYEERTYERDGAEIKLYRVRGADFTEGEFLEYFVDEDFTPEKVIQLWNVEQKSAIINEHGFEKVFDSSVAKEIHAHTIDNNGSTLEYRLFDLRIDRRRGIIARILRVQDYSTGKFAYLGVPRRWEKDDIIIQLDTCMKAVAWTFGMTEEEYKPLVET